MGRIRQDLINLGCVFFTLAALTLVSHFDIEGQLQEKQEGCQRVGRLLDEKTGECYEPD